MPTREPGESCQEVNAGRLRAALLAWYDQNARDLPWRAPPGAPPADPYLVWLSEVMLQQTTVAAVIPYFDRFREAFPTVEALAAAPREAVLGLWAGLGYYSRGRSLHAAAQVIAAAGGFPADEAGWRALPGVGPYTAAAVAAIALDQPATVVDGNVERVMARVFAVIEPLPAAKAQLRALAARFTRADRPGDFAQALMDLGATVCTPRAPACGRCPWAGACAGRASGAPEGFPRKAAKPPKPERVGACFVLRRADGAVWTVRRPERGLLAGMPGLPTTPWRAGAAFTFETALTHAPLAAPWRAAGTVRHVFTHFALDLAVYAAASDGAEPAPDGRWLTDPATLPTVFRKALELGP